MHTHTNTVSPTQAPTPTPKWPLKMWFLIWHLLHPVFPHIEPQAMHERHQSASWHIAPAHIFSFDISLQLKPLSKQLYWSPWHFVTSKDLDWPWSTNNNHHKPNNRCSSSERFCFSSITSFQFTYFPRYLIDICQVCKALAVCRKGEMQENKRRVFGGKFSKFSPFAAVEGHQGAARPSPHFILCHSNHLLYPT